MNPIKTSILIPAECVEKLKKKFPKEWACSHGRVGAFLRLILEGLTVDEKEGEE